jgi:gustatory receptor
MAQISLLTYTAVTMDSNSDVNLSDETQNTRIIFITITWTLSITYPLTTIVLFIIHCYTSSLAFDVIGKEIERCEIQIINGGDQDISVFLSVFKRKHLIVCDAVDSINRTFGRMLLLSTTFFFVAIINVSYAIFGMDNPTMTLAGALFLLFTFVHLPFICFAANHISDKVYLDYQSF